MGEPRKPIYSTHADDPALAEALDAFVVGLAQRIDALQDAEAGGDLEAAAQQAGELAEQADRLGFPALADLARQARLSARAEKADLLHAWLVELTGLAALVRRGHRGSL